MTNTRTTLDQNILWFALADEIYDIYEQKRKEQWFWRFRSKKIQRSIFLEQLRSDNKDTYLTETFSAIGSEKTAQTIKNIIETENASATDVVFQPILDAQKSICNNTTSLNQRKAEIDSHSRKLELALGYMGVQKVGLTDIESGAFTKLIKNEKCSSGIERASETRETTPSITLAQLTDNEQKALSKKEKKLFEEIDKQQPSPEGIENLINSLERRWSYWGYGNTIRAFIQKLKKARNKIAMQLAMKDTTINEQIRSITHSPIPQLHAEFMSAFKLAENSPLEEATILDKMEKAAASEIKLYAKTRKLFDEAKRNQLGLNLDYDSSQKRFSSTSNYLKIQVDFHPAIKSLNDEQQDHIRTTLALLNMLTATYPDNQTYQINKQKFLDAVTNNPTSLRNWVSQQNTDQLNPLDVSEINEMIPEIEQKCNTQPPPCSPIQSIPVKQPRVKLTLHECMTKLNVYKLPDKSPLNHEARSSIILSYNKFVDERNTTNLKDLHGLIFYQWNPMNLLEKSKQNQSELFIILDDAYHATESMQRAGNNLTTIELAQQEQPTNSTSTISTHSNTSLTDTLPTKVKNGFQAIAQIVSGRLALFNTNTHQSVPTSEPKGP